MNDTIIYINIPVRHSVKTNFQENGLFYKLLQELRTSDIKRLLDWFI